MLKIGEFSRLTHLTVKALRFYEAEGLLTPAFRDEWTAYRYYDTSQLSLAARIKAYRRLELSIDEIREILSGAEERQVLERKAAALSREKLRIDSLLSDIHHILEEEEMPYQVTEKLIPKMLVVYTETVLAHYHDCMEWIPQVGEACMELNPTLKCAEPPYEFCEYLDGEFREDNVHIRHNEAVVERGVESESIRFREIPETKVLSIFHRGSYDSIGQAYAFLMNYAEERGYRSAGLSRECYIDGIWNKDSEEEWLTEIQLPIE